MSRDLEAEVVCDEPSRVARKQVPASATVVTAASVDATGSPGAPPSGALGEIELILLGGPRDGERVMLAAGESLSCGRDVECDLQILDSVLSRLHFRLEHRGSELVVTDEGSTNGTFVDGSRKRRAVLAVGDVIKVGATSIEIRALEGAAVSGPVIQWTDETPTMGEGGLRCRFESDANGLLGSQHEHQPDQPRANYEKLYGHLRTLISTSDLLNSVQDVTQLFQMVIDTVVDLFGADRGCLVISDRREGFDKYLATSESVTKAQRWSISTTILNEALDRGMSTMTNDAGQDDRFRSGESIVLNNIQSVMCVPVESHDQVLGALYLDTITRTRPFQSDDLELLSAIGKQAGVAIQREMIKEDRDLLFLDTVRAVIAAIEAKDRYTAGHSARVASYSGTLALALGYNDTLVDRLKYAANLHDVGKIGIPEHILNKPARLTDEEFEIIQTHSTIGAGILENIRRIDDVIAGVRHHHERVDGKGYPDGLAGEDIPLLSRLIATPDTYDAMTSDRAYRRARSTAAVVDELRRHSGSQFDVRMASKMIELIQSGTIQPIATADLKIF